MTDRCQLAVIGAGPAGMAAAVQADALGLDTVLLDEQAGPGGQVYRSVDRSPLRGTRMRARASTVTERSLRSTTSHRALPS
jgi:thioredoxin reductase